MEVFQEVHLFWDGPYSCSDTEDLRGVHVGRLRELNHDDASPSVEDGVLLDDSGRVCIAFFPGERRGDSVRG